MSLIRKINQMGRFPFFEEKGLFDINFDDLFNEPAKNIEKRIDEMFNDNPESLKNITFSVYNYDADNNDYERLVNLKNKYGDSVKIEFNGKEVLGNKVEEDVKPTLDINLDNEDTDGAYVGECKVETPIEETSTINSDEIKAEEKVVTMKQVEDMVTDVYNKVYNKLMEEGKICPEEIYDDEK